MPSFGYGNFLSLFFFYSPFKQHKDAMKGNGRDEQVDYGVVMLTFSFFVFAHKIYVCFVFSFFLFFLQLAGQLVGPVVPVDGGLKEWLVLCSHTRQTKRQTTQPRILKTQ